MANPIWFDDTHVIPATVESITSEQADSPASRLVQIGPRWERSWRSTGLAEQSGVIAFDGGSQDVVALVVYAANFNQIEINGTLYTMQIDFDGMYKMFKEVTISDDAIPFTIPAQTPSDGVGHYRLGRLLFVKTLIEVEQCPESVSREIFDPQVQAENELGVFDTLPAGSPYSRESWSGKWVTDEIPNIRALFHRRAHRWVGLFRNLSPTRDYEFMFAGRDGGIRINYGNVTVDMDVSWRQVA
jgi:hypothetical protein